MSAAWQVRLVWGDERAIDWPVDVVIHADARWPDAEHNAMLPNVLTLASGLDDAPDVARRALAAQAELGRRAMITVIATGDRSASGALIPTAADHLVAGAIVDELATLGIDFHCPSSAIACAAATTLRGARQALIRADLESRRAS